MGGHDSQELAQVWKTRAELPAPVAQLPPRISAASEDLAYPPRILQGKREEGEKRERKREEKERKGGRKRWKVNGGRENLPVARVR